MTVRGVRLWGRDDGEAESDEGESDESHVTRIPFEGGAAVVPCPFVALTTQVTRCV